MSPLRPWERLGIGEDEWRLCELSAAEASRARGANVSPDEVARDYARARDADAAALAAAMARGRPRA